MATLARRSASSTKKTRSISINMRMNPQQQVIIDSAAEASGKSRSAFILETAYQAALDTLLNQNHFILNPEQWSKFVEALDAPPSENEQLAKLLSKKAPWE